MKKTVITLSLLASISLYAETQIVNLYDAINIALKNNNSLKISQTSIEIAEAMYKQAMSANYPTLDASVSAMRMDENPTFSMVGTTTIDNRQQKALYTNLGNAATADGDYNTAGTYAAIVAATPDQTQLPIDMEVKIADRDSVFSQIKMQYPLYVGGKITAITEQAALGKRIAQEGKRRTKNQVIYDVKRYYYGVVLTKQLKKLSHDTLERMEFIRDLTSRLYQGGSMHVKKTDYLRSKLSVSLIESLDEKIGQKEAMAKAALLNAMGLSWQTEIDVSDTQLQKPVMNERMKELVNNAYKFNPDYTTLKLAIDVKKAKIDESKSGYLPHVGLTASAQNIYNDYKYGMVNDANKNSWTIGIGATWSLFNGMRTINEVEQSKLEKMKLEQTKVLLKEGLALQVKQAFLEMKSSYKQFNILSEAVENAKENRELNTRAYQEDMVKTKDVIEAQFFESYTQGDFYRSEYAHAVARAKLDFIVGAAMEDEK
jgi:outer membrane protein TolC